MADNIWDPVAGDDGGVDANWSLGHVPTGSETALFDATSTDDCTLSGALLCGVVNVTDAYGTGHFNANGHDVTTSGNITFANSTGTVSMGTGTWTLTGDGATFDYSTVGTLNRGTSVLTFSCGAGESQTIIGTSTKYLCSLTVSANATLEVNSAASTYCWFRDGDVNIYGTVTVLFNRYFGLCGDTDLYLRDGGVLDGAGHLSMSSTLGAGYGIKLIHSGSTLSVAYLDWGASGQTHTLVAGVYACTTKVSFSGKGTWNLDGEYTFTVQLQLKANSGTGDVTFACANGTTVNSAGLLNFDTGTGDCIVDNSAGTVNWNISGNVTLTNGANLVWTKGTGTITIDGSGNQSIGLGDQSIEALIIANTGGEVTFTGGWTATSFNAQAGDFDPNGQTLESLGDFTIAAGVNLVSAAQGDQLWAGTALTVGGTFAAVGVVGDLCNLRGDTGWTLDATAAGVVSKVHVEDSDASTGVDITAVSSADGTNNTGWVFASSEGGQFTMIRTEHVMLPSFFKFIVVNESGQTVTYDSNGRLNLKVTGVQIDGADPSKRAYTELADDDLGFGATDTLANAAEILGSEIDNTGERYVGLLVQLEVTHDEGTAADGIFRVYVAAGDASGELSSDASGYAGAKANELEYVGSLVWESNGLDDELMRSNVFRI